MIKILPATKFLFLFIFFGLNIGSAKAQDTIRPVITLNFGSANKIEMMCVSGPYVDPGAVAMDNLEGDITSRMVVTNNVNTRRIGTYQVKYVVSDTSGNTATAYRTITVEDTKGGFGFNMDSLGNDFIFYTDGLTRNRTDYNWYIDGQLIRGFKDLKLWMYFKPDILTFFHDDTLAHEIRMDQYYCDNDTMIPYSKQVSAKLYNGILGSVFTDLDSNCNRSKSELGLKAIPIKLYDSSNNWLATTYSLINGTYYFNNNTGKYKVLVDTTKLPMQLSCPTNGNSKNFDLGNQPSLKDKIDFGFKCSDQFDIGVDLHFFNLLKPGQRTCLYMDFEDWSATYGLQCLKKINGRVMLKLEGKLKYIDTFRNLIKPDSIQGDVYFFNVADFANPDIMKPTFLYFQVDTNANIGDTIVASIKIDLASGDLDSNNNRGRLYGTVLNSRDPNYKMVEPAEVKPAYADWLNYTVHFQNNGNDSALNIRLRDTLSSLLDVETFEFLGSSHKVQSTLSGNALMFYYKNIMLPDSATNPITSQGFVKYRIKPKKNLAEGTLIPNKAFIYFDYNSPILTNTALVEFKTPKTSTVNQINVSRHLLIYPNPGNGVYSIEGKINSTIIVYNLYGQVVYQGKMISAEQSFDFSYLANGFYIVESNGMNGTFIKQ